MRARQRTMTAAMALAALSFAGPALAAQADALSYCKADVARLCPGVQMGGGRIIACLKGHKMELSVGCAQGLQKLKSQMSK
jgi:Cysteine rich repeat